MPRTWRAPGNHGQHIVYVQFPRHGLRILRTAGAHGANGRAAMPFPALFGAGDFSATDLDSHLPPEVCFNLVSCQFALHYSFGTEQRATQMLKNVASRLLPGGVFVATIPDANVLVRRLRSAEGLGFGLRAARGRSRASPSRATGPAPRGSA